MFNENNFEYKQTSLNEAITVKTGRGSLITGLIKAITWAFLITGLISYSRALTNSYFIHDIWQKNIFFGKFLSTYISWSVLIENNFG